jgi:hypothetical protein
VSDFDVLLDAAVERKTVAPVFVLVDVLVGESVVSLKFFEGDSRDWAHATASSPQRLDVPLDLNYGYNVHAAAERMATFCGVRVDDGVDVKLEPEQWKKLFDVLSGHDVGAVTDAVWGLNEFHPSQRLAKAKKALAGVQGRKRS